jgi:hypothetical protein
MPTSEEMKRYCEEQLVVPAHHCCLEMAYNLAHPVLTPHQGKNRVIDWIDSWDEYLIPISHDGYASTQMKFCPWCGSRLPVSKKEEWYRRLYALGFKDPGNESIPAEFESDKWWRA